MLLHELSGLTTPTAVVKDVFQGFFLYFLFYLRTKSLSYSHASNSQYPTTVSLQLQHVFKNLLYFLTDNSANQTWLKVSLLKVQTESRTNSPVKATPLSPRACILTLMKEMHFAVVHALHINLNFKICGSCEPCHLPSAPCLQEPACEECWQLNSEAAA